MNNLDLLLRDYEMQLDESRRRSYEADAVEVRRSEAAKIHLADRLAAQIGKELVVYGLNAEIWRGTLKNIGLGWIQLEASAGDLIVPLASVMWWEGGDSKSYKPSHEVSRKLTLGYVLRALATSQQVVSISHGGPESPLTEGRVITVGADYCELLVQRIEAKEGGQRSEIRVIPFAAIMALRTR